MEVPLARRRISFLEKAVKRFWLRFSPEGRDFIEFARSQKDEFPNSFIDLLIRGLHRAKWTLDQDYPCYKIPRKIMTRLVVLFADPDQYISSIFDLEKRAKKMADRERKKLIAISMQVSLSDCRDVVLLEDAVERFWDRFFPERGYFFEFSLTQSPEFPPSFIDRLFQALNRVRWNRHVDPGYKIPQKILGRLVKRFADPDQFISSIFELEKRMKKRADKVRKKLSAIPPWDLSAIEESINQFWVTFSSVDEADLPSFAMSQANNFPPNYIAEFLRRLVRAEGWSQSTDPDHKLPRKLMSRLASSMAKAAEMVDDCFVLVTRMEAEMEAALRRAEAEKMALEVQLKRQEDYAIAKAEGARKKALRAEKAAQKKERKRIRTEKNNLNRVRAKALGIK